ncbi:MAG TPA: hypothetical protein VFI13_09775, partial [Gemmatimonadales bacterium]|nr:hypothetical protein [Gemmatimonadales bacterium]
MSVAASRIALLTGSPAGLGRPLTHPLAGLPRFALTGVAACGVGLVLVLRRWRRLPVAVLGLVAAAFLVTYRLYPPGAYFLARRALAQSELRPLVASGERWGLASAIACLAALLPFLPGLLASLVRTGDLHGSARLASPEDILASGFVFD